MKTIRNVLSFPLIVMGVVLVSSGVVIRHGLVMGTDIISAMERATREQAL